MKTPFRRQLMFILLAAFAALPLFAAQLIAAPNVQFAVLELKQSPTGEINITKAVVPNDLDLAIFLVNLPADEYIVFKNNAALQTMRAADTTQFADNKKSSATFRRGLVINTDGCSYVLFAINRAMNTEVPLPPTVLAHGNTKTGGSMFQINTMFDERAATLDQNPDGAWIVTR